MPVIQWMTMDPSTVSAALTPRGWLTAAKISGTQTPYE